MAINDGIRFLQMKASLLIHIPFIHRHMYHISMKHAVGTERDFLLHSALDIYRSLQYDRCPYYGSSALVQTGPVKFIKITAGPAIGRAGDLAAILTNLNDNDVLFIDEIHRLNRSVEEVLYSAMEDYVLDIIIGKGPAARSLRIDIAKFTLIGATTRAGSLSGPLRDRFGIVEKFEFYTPAEIKEILRRTANVLETTIDEASLDEISKRSRGTPRIGNRLIKRVRDFSSVEADGGINIDITMRALEALGVDELGLEKLDRDILKTIIKNFNGGPVGIETIASAIGEERVTIEDANEPYLIQAGLLYRTQKGRMASRAAYEHLGLGGLYKEPETEQLRMDIE